MKTGKWIGWLLSIGLCLLCGIALAASTMQGKFVVDHSDSSSAVTKYYIMDIADTQEHKFSLQIDDIHTVAGDGGALLTLSWAETMDITADTLTRLEYTVMVDDLNIDTGVTKYVLSASPNPAKHIVIAATSGVSPFKLILDWFAW